MPIDMRDEFIRVLDKDTGPVLLWKRVSGEEMPGEKYTELPEHFAEDLIGQDITKLPLDVREAMRALEVQADFFTFTNDNSIN